MSAVVLWILGAGGHGRVVADAAAASGRFAEIVFFDDDTACGGTVGRWLVRGNGEAFLRAPVPQAKAQVGAKPRAPIDNTPAVERHIAVGRNALRDSLAERCEVLGLALATVVHPAAVLSVDARLAPGCFIAAGAVVAPGAELGVASIVNHGASVDHDCRLGRAVHVGPGAHLGGGAMVDEQAWIGLGAAVKHGIHIGRGATVGAGAVVVADVPADICVIGNPARPMHIGAGPSHA